MNYASARVYLDTNNVEIVETNTGAVVSKTGIPEIGKKWKTEIGDICGKLAQKKRLKLSGYRIIEKEIQ